MKVCLVHEEYPDETNFGGIATYQKILAESLVKYGFEVTVIARSLECDKEYIENNVKVIRIHVDKTNDVYSDYVNYRTRVSDKLIELQDHNEIDIIETPDWGAETVLFEKYRKVPLIVRLHTPLGIWSKANSSELDPSIHKQMLKWEKKMIESADKVTSCTEILRDLVKKELKITRKDIEVIPNPANFEDFYVKRLRGRKRKTILYCGSIEQRKGVILLAHAIPNIIERIGNVKFLFVGKDTDRNEEGISTIEYIKRIVPSKYHKNLEFRNQIQNSELNSIYNKVLMGVFPSLFDNFPYVVLESMASGLPFVGSINSGMREMLDGDTKYLYDAKTSKDLENKIVELYTDRKSLNTLSKKLVKKVNDKYSLDVVTKMFVDVYNSTITDYNKKLVDGIVEEHIKEPLVNMEKIETGLANTVYFVETTMNKYIVKIYRKNIDQTAINALIKIAKKHKIKILKNIDNTFYSFKNCTICIYEYVEGKHIKKLSNEQINKIVDFIKIDKPTKGKYNNLLDKVNFYYESLRELETKKIRRDFIEELLRRYMKLQNYNIFYEKELVHGDLTPTNIIWDDNDSYTIIDLDETIEFTKLYDLIVFAIKFSKNGSEIDVKMAKKILKPFNDYTKIDIINVWNFYLLKVILEKIYLYEIGKIDLTDEKQMKDNWEDWYKILESGVIEEILNK